MSDEACLLKRLGPVVVIVTTGRQPARKTGLVVVIVTTGHQPAKKTGPVV